jgi:hypothetical protein
VSLCGKRQEMGTHEDSPGTLLATDWNPRLHIKRIGSLRDLTAGAPKDTPWVGVVQGPRESPSSHSGNVGPVAGK